MTPSLFVLRGREQGQRFYLDLPLVCIGRHRKNDIQLQDTEVSRRHAQIVTQNEKFYLEDLGSVNGTNINDERIEKRELIGGDRILLGKTLLLFTDDSSQNVEKETPNVKITDQSSVYSIPKIVSSAAEASSVFEEAGAGKSESNVGVAEANLSEHSEDGKPHISHKAGVNISQAHLDVMYQTSLAVSHTLDIDELLKRIMKLILNRVYADRGCIFLLDQQTGKPVPQVAVHSRSNAEEIPIEISNTILEYVLTNQEGILTENAANDDRFSDPQSVLEFGIREAICVPMTGRYGVVGAIYVDTSTKLDFPADGDPAAHHQSSRLMKEDLQLLLAIGNQAGIAVEDTGFYSGLVQSERLAAIGQTIAVMSHHIKNTLQGFQGGGYLIEQGCQKKDFEIVQQGWKILQRNQDRVYNLVMDMLSFSKERSPYRQLIKIDELVSEVVESLEPKGQQMGVELKLKVEESIPPAMIDQESIHRAVLNVISNAIDALLTVDHKQPIEIEVKHVPSKTDPSEPGFLEVHVQDYGPGIEEDLMEKVFSLFESTKGGRGTGLGLPVSKKIMNEHRGDIDVYSKPGHGTKFVLWLPIINSERTGETLVGSGGNS